MDDVNFSPESLTIKSGDVVHIKNVGTTIYDISVIDADGDVDDLGLQRPGKEILKKFDKRGEYKVRCTVDPMMKMTITVQ